MKPNISFNKDNYKKQREKFLLLGNPNHLRILLILEEAKRPMTTEEIRAILEKENVYKHRENTHKALQKLVRVGLIKKEKGPNKVGDVYFLP
ncbi:MAG: winged helix-turn-helix transcriptional regulator [Nanoarchaeota archaeon]|nr:winged helix-turn-helix transcriptional regulator [Nanoarchaeota archaeon]